MCCYCPAGSMVCLEGPTDVEPEPEASMECPECGCVPCECLTDAGELALLAGDEDYSAWLAGRAAEVLACMDAFEIPGEWRNAVGT